MRVELLYAPGCTSLTKARNILETLIAEERLPIPVEVVEEDGQVGGSPTVRINGHDNKVHCVETLRDTLNLRWKELTEAPLLGV